MQRDMMPRARLRPLWLGLVAMGFLLSATSHTGMAGEATVQRLIFGSAGFTEGNRFWTIAVLSICNLTPFWRPCSTSTPRRESSSRAWRRKWQASPDMKEWTFFLRKGLQFHNGFGEFTAKDVAHSHSFMLRQMPPRRCPIGASLKR